MKKNKIICCALSLAMAVTLFAGCSKKIENTSATSTFDYKDKTISGIVTKIDGSKVTVQVNPMSGDGRTPPNAPSGNASGSAISGGEASEKPDDSTSGNNKQSKEAPEKPDDSTSGDDKQGGTPPDMPGGNASGSAIGGGEAPEKPDGNTNGDDKQGETGVITINDDSLISVSDISDGDMLSVTFDKNGKITAISKQDSQKPGENSVNGDNQAPGGQSAKVDSYDSANEYSEDKTVKNKKLSSTGTDENAALVDNGAKVTFDNVSIDRTSSDSTGGDNSSFYGVGAALLTTDGTSTIKGGSITTDASGAAGVFSYGQGKTYISDTKITTSKDTSGGIHAAGGGSLYAWNLDVTTNGESSAAIRSDRGGGTMVVDGGSYVSNGVGSPSVYCTADIAVNNATLTANGSEAICMEGLNTIHLFDCDITGSMKDLDQNDTTWNVIVYQSMSGDSEVGNSTMQLIGGSLTAKNGGMFYTTNTECNILLSDVDIKYSDDNPFFLQCTGNNNKRGWGTSGANGSDCVFTAEKQDMKGDIIWDSISKLDLYMKDGSILKGAVKDDETYAGNGGDGYCNISVSKDSKWIVTGDSELTTLSNEGTIVDKDNKKVTIKGTDGKVYVKGDGKYTITVDKYSESADFSNAATADSWSSHEVK